MAEQYSLYHGGSTFLYRLNPVTKLVLSVCLILLSFLAMGYWTPWFLLGLSLILTTLNQLLKPFLQILIKFILPLSFFLFIIHGFFSPLGHTVISQIGPFTLKLEGLEFALLMMGRILSALGASLLLVFTTLPSSLMLALSQNGVPYVLTYIIGATLQIIPQMKARTTAIISAQQSRGLETDGSFFIRVKALLPLIIPLVLSSLVDVEERAIALEARAFRTECIKTSLIDLSDPLSERIFRWALVGVMVLIIGIGWFYR